MSNVEPSDVICQTHNWKKRDEEHRDNESLGVGQQSKSNPNRTTDKVTPKLEFTEPT